MTLLGTAVLRIETDNSAVDKGLDETKHKAEGLGSVLKTAVGTAAGFVIGQGLLEAPRLIGSAVGAASDLNESLSKSNTIFKENAGAVESWASNGARNFGLSKQAALDAAGGFGNMFDQLGIGRDKAADMSMGIVELAADFASFHNADISQVLDAQSAAFRGEYDSLQRFLPLINAATVEQKAMAMTGKDNAKELTAQEKALAVNALMMEGAGEAMGDFARTSEGLANRQRILKAEFSNIQAEIGNALLPILVAVAGFILDTLIPAIGSLIDFIGPAIQAAIQGASQAFAFLKGLLGENGDAVGQAQGKWQQIVAYFYAEVLPAFQAIANRVQEVVQWVQEHWSQIEPIIRGPLEAARAIVEFQLNSIFNIIDFVLNLIQGDWQGAWDAIKNQVENTLRLIETLFNAYMTSYNAIISLAWEGIKWITEQVWNGILSLLQQLWDEIVASVQHGVDSTIQRIEDAWNWIQRMTHDAWWGIVHTVQDVLNQLPGWIYDFGRYLVGQFGQAFDDARGWLLGKLTGWANDIINTVKSGFGVFSPSKVFYDIGRNIVAGLANAIMNDPGSILKQALDSTVNNIISQFSGLASGIGNAIGDVGGAIGGALGIGGGGSSVEKWRSLVAEFFPASEVQRALNVMALESGGNPSAVGVNADGSRDVGLFQINDIHGLSMNSRLDPRSNVAFAAQLWRSQGWAPWVAAQKLGYRLWGGPVNANQPYIVGERGWEMFVPKASGYIFNHKQSKRMAEGGFGGLQVAHMTVYANDEKRARLAAGNVLYTFGTAARARGFVNA